MMSRTGPRIFAIRYAHREAQSSEHFYGEDPHEGPMPMDYFIWVIVGDDEAIIVDAGFTAETASRRKRELLCDPIEVLRTLGVDAAEVRNVLLTHLHYDHSGHIGAFPNARFWLQDREMAFWSGRYAGRRDIVRSVEPKDVIALVQLNFDGRVRFLDGDGQVARDVHLHRVGGHTPGMQVVTVNTADGRIVLASDTTHFYENIEEDRSFSVLHCLPGMYGAFDRVHELAGSSDHIIPGHDPLVLERYPCAATGLEGLAVELSVLGRLDV